MVKDFCLEGINVWIIGILVAGSIVDIVQFFWLIRRSYRKWRRMLLNHAKRALMLEEYERRQKSERSG